MKHVIQKLKDSHPNYLTYDEAKTRQVLILPILQSLGWDIFDGDEVFPEYGVAGKRVDFSLRENSRNLFFIEVKKCSVDLDSHQEQLLGYAFREGVSLACLTNGITWQFFLPLTEGTWENRLFYTINMKEQGADEIAEILEFILKKDIVMSKEAVRNANELKQENIKSEILDKNIPKVWKDLLQNPSEDFITAIADKVEVTCGYRPSIHKVTTFLFGLQDTTKRTILVQQKENKINNFSVQHFSGGSVDRSFVVIKGVKIFTVREGNDSKRYFREIIPKLISTLPLREIENLQNISYCNELKLTGKQYPVLSKDEGEMFGGDNRFRAYPYKIAGFWVTKEWSKERLQSWKEYLEKLANELG